MLPLLILVPLAALLLCNLPFNRQIRCTAVFLFAGAWSLIQSAMVLFRTDVLVAPSAINKFISFGLHLTDVGRVLLLTIGVVTFAAVMVGNRMVTGERARFNFINVLLVSLVGMNGAVTVTDLFSLYVFLEVTSVSSFVLIAFNRDRNGLEGAFKYLVMSAVATVMMLTAVGLMLMFAGDTSFSAVHKALTVNGGHMLAKLAMILFVSGLFIKGGLVPFHGWLPAAYSAAPAPVSVLLGGVVTKVSGIYALVQLSQNVFPPNAVVNHILMVVGTASIIVGALAALGQTDMKRLLAYSSISQVGYIILALGAAGQGGTPGKLALAGAVFHLFNHAIFKSLLFCNSAAVEDIVGTTDMLRLGGLGARMPLTSATSVVGLLSTAGIPPLSGFWSKLLIIVALWQSGLYAYAVLAVLFSVVTLAYLLTMQRKVFFGTLREELSRVTEVGMSLLLPQVILAIVTIALGVLFPLLFNTFLLPVGKL